MAEGFPTVEVDARNAIARFTKIPENVRNNLRRDIPGLTKSVTKTVREKLIPGVLFKTTTRLLPAVRQMMVENPHEVVGRVFVDPTLFPAVVANTLESGSRPHEIRARYASALFFFWAKLGKNVAFQKVNHPGFAGRSYMQSSFQEHLPDIRATLEASIFEAVSQ